MTTANKITLISDHVARAKSRLLYQFKDKEKINAIVEALVKEIQEVEDILIDLQDLRTLENASGVLLDNIGEKLKVRRNNLDDNDYKTAIKVRILRKANKGTQADIMEVFKLLTKDNDPFVNNTHPYVVELVATLACIAKTDAGINELVDMFPVNTGVRIINKPNRPFGFAGNPDAYPFNSISYAVLNGQMCSLIKTFFGNVEDGRFSKVETFIPPTQFLPSPSVTPYLTFDSLAEGSVLTANDGVWAGDTPITFQYQWFVDGSAVEGETNSTYTILLSDLNKDIYCRVIASNDVGSYESFTQVVVWTEPDTGGIVSGLGLPAFMSDTLYYIGPELLQAVKIMVTFGSDGTLIVDRLNAPNTNSAYLDTTGAGVGAGYEVKVDKISGDNLTLPTQIGIWQSLSSNRSFSLSASSLLPTYQVKSGVFQFSVRNTTTGIIESKQATLYIELNVENDF